MRILCISDLHLPSNAIRDFYNRDCKNEFINSIKDTIIQADPDVVVNTGDTVWSREVNRLSLTMRSFIPSPIPIVVTLGNHEFWENGFEKTLKKLENQQHLIDKNIFYLDLIGSVEIGGINFVGGTLFFDGSMRYRENQRVDEWDGWQDFRIPEIQTRYLEFNNYYIDMIKANMKSGMPTALCTHHVPHVRLNGHEPSHYSFYTGMNDLVSQLSFDPLYDNYLICGHTHKRVIGEVVRGFMGINVGSDYNQFKHYTIKV